MTTQTYQNHVHRPYAWTATFLLAFFAFLTFVVHAIRFPSDEAVGLAVLAWIIVMLTVVVRRFATKLQDRIIRLEMHVRLAQLGRGADMARLSVRQLVALRFASDAELPSLIERALAEAMTPDQIKRAVTNWQGDYLRT